MRLKNLLLVVRKIESSKRFYHDLFGLEVIADFGKNVMMTERLVLQEQEIWEVSLEKRYNMAATMQNFILKRVGWTYF